ncbi:GerMN domain-containing protein [Desulfofalx alkaliphila]|uniref:GerMN domain-containing protein n=1 Tax=Desulfofalx alkaliphila TaxID=105483 RepID=UPI0004E19E13|nr:GerMN domain-containing protein [Desulfofalx alkaliphila]
MKRRWLPVIGLMLAALMVFAAGCGGGDKQAEPQGDPDDKGQDTQQIEVTLYFSDDQAMYLVPEQRIIEVESDDPEVVGKAVIEALIEGSDTLLKTVPEESQVLSIEVVENAALVDFNRALKDNHWGGSTGETFTVYSIVNSLAKNIGVNEVQFTIEGEIEESIFGHMPTTEPFTPNFDLIKE